MTPVKASEFGNKTLQGQRDLFYQQNQNQNQNPYQLGVGSLNQPPQQQQQATPMATGGIVALARGGMPGYAGNEGSLVGEDAALKAYQEGRYKDASTLLAEAGMGAQDVVSKYGLSQADAATVAKNLGYTGDMSGIQYAAPPVDQTTNIQNLPVIPNNNALNAQAVNPVDAEMLDYYDKNKNLFESKDYNKIASDMFVNEFTPEAFARVKGFDQKAVTDLYNQTYGGFDRATQEDLVNQKYKQQLGLTDAQLGQRYFGADMSTRESRLASSPFSNAYETYLEELASTGRRDAPAGSMPRWSRPSGAA
jgi:hypothetical protein